MSIRTSEGWSAPRALARDPNAVRTLLLGALGLVLVAVCGHPAEARRRAKEEPLFAATLPPAPIAQPANGAIFQPAMGYAALVEGQRARRVGDTLTIVLVERTAASKSASSNLSRDGSLGITPPTTGPLSVFKASDASIGSNSKFKGAGTADQSNTLSGEVSVTIAETYPNGTMLVRGQKTVTLNRGDEYIQISGVVRSADINPDNQVLSTRVADARIKYTGTGDVARSSRQGWFSRFFQAVTPF